MLRCARAIALFRLCVLVAFRFLESSFAARGMISGARRVGRCARGADSLKRLLQPREHSEVRTVGGAGERRISTPPRSLVPRCFNWGRWRAPNKYAVARFDSSLVRLFRLGRWRAPDKYAYPRFNSSLVRFFHFFHFSLFFCAWRTVKRF